VGAFVCREGAWAELTVEVTFVRKFRWAVYGKKMSEFLLSFKLIFPFLFQLNIQTVLGIDF